MNYRNQWSSAALPLSILLILAVITFWLRYATEFPPARNDGKTRHDPDYVIAGATLKKLDSAGKLQYTLVADRVRHYPDSDTTDLENPRMLYLHPTKPPVTVSARQGHLTSKAKTVELHDEVEVRRQATDAHDELLVRSAQLTVLTDEEKAFTKNEVHITQGASWVRGTGMQVDNKLQTYLLESRVTGEIASRYREGRGSSSRATNSRPVGKQQAE